MQAIYGLVLLILGSLALFSECWCNRLLIYTPLFLYTVYTVLKNHGLLPKKSLAGQHVFITGGAMGIGRSMALKLAKMGCKLTLVDINFEALQKTQRELGSDVKSFIAKCDVSNIEEVNKVASESVAALGEVDILINNAGIVSGKKILENSEARIKATVDVNTVSHHWTVRAFLPSMLKRNHGHIVTVASMAGYMAVSGLADYCASKFGAVGFDESLRQELNYLKSNVKTTCIAPFYINTGMFEGINVKFQFFLPILQEGYVSQRIINAIQQDEKIVVLPWFGNLTIFLKAVLPVSVYDKLIDLFGGNKYMDHFVGRKN